MKITEKQLLKLWNCFVAELQYRNLHSESNSLFSFDEKIALQKEITDQQSEEIVETDKNDHRKMKTIAGSHEQTDKSA